MTLCIRKAVKQWLMTWLRRLKIGKEEQSNMLDFLLWNKIARVIAQLATTLNVSNDRALAIFYDSEVCKMLHNPEFGLHLMSDTYIVNDLIEELRMKQ